MQHLQELSDEALLEQAADPSTCLRLASELLRQDPQRLARLAEALLVLTGGADAADAMMERNPALFEHRVAHAAERCGDAAARFRLWRAVFRRYPGHYREQVFEAGRRAMRLPDDRLATEVAVWMTDKFGQEVVPDLVDLMHRTEGEGCRIPALHEAVKVMGPGAVPVAEAALESGFPALAEAARHALHALGADPAEAAAG